MSSDPNVTLADPKPTPAASPQSANPSSGSSRAFHLKLINNPLLTTSILTLGLGLFIIIGGLAAPTNIVISNDLEKELGSLGGSVDISGGVGLFKISFEVEVPGLSSTISVDGDTCDIYFMSLSALSDPNAQSFIDSLDDTDCYSALKSKCQTAQAFGILGFLAQLAAAGLVGLELSQIVADPNSMLVKISVYCIATASFCYLIVWSVWASIMNGESPEPFSSKDAWSESSCGTADYVLTGTEKVDAYVGGPGFGCWVFMWLVTGGLALVLFVQVSGIIDVNAMCDCAKCRGSQPQSTTTSNRYK